MRRFGRRDSHAHLRATIDRGEPVIMAEAGNRPRVQGAAAAIGRAT